MLLNFDLLKDANSQLDLKKNRKERARKKSKKPKQNVSGFSLMKFLRLHKTQVHMVDMMIRIISIIPLNLAKLLLPKNSCLTTKSESLFLN